MSVLPQMGTLAYADREELMRFYYNLPWDQLNPSFIQLSPTLVDQAAFSALESYDEPVEPKIIEGLDYSAFKEQARQNVQAFLKRVHVPLSRCPTTYEKLFFLLRSGYFRKGTIAQTRFDENKELFRPIIEAHLRRGTPLEFTLPAFPFKFTNPIKSSRHAPDMAEVLCLSRLYEICLAIEAIYPPGAQFNIISDGQVYHRFFAVTHYHALQYRAICQSMIQRLGFEDKLELVDMLDLITTQQDRFYAVHTGLRHSFQNWWVHNPTNEQRRYLTRTAAANIDLSLGVSHDLIQLATHNILTELDVASTITNLNKVRHRIHQRADQAAFEFALFLYTLREMDLVNSCYPDAIRATVHPKPGQWGPHLVNRKSRIFPWQGVAYREANGEWKIKYEFEVIRKKACPIYLKGDAFPFYYEGGQDEDEFEAGEQESVECSA